MAREEAERLQAQLLQQEARSASERPRAGHPERWIWAVARWLPVVVWRRPRLGFAIVLIRQVYMGVFHINLSGSRIELGLK